MIAKALMGVVGAAAVAATLPLSGYHTEKTAPVAVKGDRLAVAVSGCAHGCTALAVTTVPAGRWITIEGQVGEASSVLIRVPVADIMAAEVISQIFSGALRTDGATDVIASAQR